VKEEIRKMLDQAHGTKLQNSYGLATKPRAKKLSVQLQSALDDAATLNKAKTDEALVSRIKLAQGRIATLTTLVNRKRHETFKKLNDQLTAAKLEIIKLKSDLAAALAAKPTATETDHIRRTLADFEASKRTTGGL
jgi:hypothetical protein